MKEQINLAPGRIGELVTATFPNARRVGATFRVGDITGAPGNSLAIDASTGVYCEHATGAGGDFVELLMAARGWTFQQAKKAVCGSAERPSRAIKTGAGAKYVAPKTDSGSYGDQIELRNSRPLPMTAGIELARIRGWLAFGNHRLNRCWVAMDANCAQWRRLDGQPFWTNGPKAETARWSKCANGIGWRDAGQRSEIFLTEGPPDAVAILTALFICERHRDAGTVAMLGSTGNMGPDALAACSEKPVTIISDPDGAGQRAAQRWGRQLAGAGCKVKIWRSPTGQDFSDWLAGADEWAGWNPAKLSAKIKGELCL